MQQTRRRQEDGVVIFEVMERSTEHPDRPLLESSKETGIKREYIRGYVFVYIQLRARRDGSGCDMRGMVAVDMRGDLPKGLLQKLFASVSENMAKKTRKEIVRPVLPLPSRAPFLLPPWLSAASAEAL